MEPHQEETNKHPGASLGLAGSDVSTVQPTRNAQSSYKVGRMVLRIVAIYVVVAALWILVSDQVLVALVKDHALLVKIEVAKGWFFVAVTAALLFVLLRRETRHWIAERKAREDAEAVTQESERRFRLLFDLAPLPVAFYKLSGEAVNFNRRFKQELGYSVTDLPTVNHWQRLAHPDENERREAVARWEAAAQRAITGNATIEPDEYKITCKNGETRTFLLSGSILGDGILVAFIDITERKRAEDAVRDSEARYRLLAENTADVIWVLDLARNRFIYVSPSVERLRGYTPEEVREHTMEQALTPASYAMVRKELPDRLAAFQAGDPAAVTQLREVEQPRKDGSAVWTEVSTTLIKTSSGEIQVLGVSRDITARRQVEEALRKSEERFRQMAESIDEVFWMTGTRADKMLYVSPAYEKVWGRTCESLHANPSSWIDAVHADDRQQVLEAAKARASGVAYAETYRILHTNNKVRWVHVRSFPIRDSSGQIYRTVGIAADITEHRKLEDQYRQAQKLEAIGTLAGGIAHDFNNILGAILGYAELAKTENITPLTEKSLDEILRACKRAGDLVKQILTFSRQQEQKRQPMQLWRVVDEVVRLLRAALPSTIQFETELANEVPNVLADATQIHQVVMNLCTNAAHAMTGRTNGRLGLKLDRFEAGEEFVKVHPGSRVGVYTRLVVSDNGSGMDRAVLDRIFEPFFTTKRPGEGTGLGLSVVHGIMQSHEGLITVYSRPEEGTSFHLYFPAYESGEIESAVASDKIVQGKGECILVVDDEEHLAHMAGKMLEKLGYQVEVVTDPVQALQTVHSEKAKFDLVLADLTMPGITGLQLAAEVLRVHPTTPVVLMTGYLAKETREQIQAAGIREVLLKPIMMRDLGETLYRFLKH